MDFAFYWGHTDAVSKTLFFILFALSIISWVVGIIRVAQSCKLAGSIGDSLKQSISSSATDLDGLDFGQKKMVVEQKLLQNVARYRYEMEKVCQS